MHVLDVNGLNSNDMKQTIQHTAVQKAMQPVARYIKTGLEHVAIYIYIYDTDEDIQQQADDNTADLEDLQVIKKKKDNVFLRCLYT